MNTEAYNRRRWLPWVLLLAFVLAGLGNWFEHQQSPEPETLWDLLYETLLIFGLERHDDSTAHWPVLLQFARIFGPAVLVWTVIETALFFARDNFTESRLRRLKGHTVCFGSGAQGFRVAEQLVSDPKAKNIIIVEPETDNVNLPVLEAKGATVVHGRGDSSAVLARAQIANADRALVFTDDSSTNIAIARTICEMTERRVSSEALQSEALQLFLRVDDARMARLLAEGNSLGAISEKVEIRPFYGPQVMARLLLKDHPTFVPHLPQNDSDAPLHVLCVGFECVGQAILRQVIRSSHFGDERNVQITIVSESHRREQVRFQSRFHHLSMVADLHFHVADPLGVPVEQWQTLQSRGVFHVAYISDDEDVDAIEIANHLIHIQASINPLFKAVVCLNQTGACAAVSHGRDRAVTALPAVHLFNALEHALDMVNIFDEVADKCARAIHENYEAKALEEGSVRPEAPWSSLTPTMRDRNRAAADHLVTKLAIAGGYSSAVNPLLNHQFIEGFIDRNQSFERDTLVEAKLIESNPPAAGSSIISEQQRTDAGEVLLQEAKSLLDRLLYGRPETGVYFDRSTGCQLSIIVPAAKAFVFEFLKAETRSPVKGHWRDSEGAAHDVAANNLKIEVVFGDAPKESGKSVQNYVQRCLELINLLEVNEVKLYTEIDGLDAHSLDVGQRKHFLRSLRKNEEGLEHLARVEHRRWMAHTILEGWVPGLELKKKDPSTMRHHCLRPYDELEESDKLKDKESVELVVEMAFKDGAFLDQLV